LPIDITQQTVFRKSIPEQLMCGKSGVQISGQSNLTQRCKRFTTASTSRQVAVLPWHYIAKMGTTNYTLRRNTASIMVWLFRKSSFSITPQSTILQHSQHRQKNDSISSFDSIIFYGSHIFLELIIPYSVNFETNINTQTLK